MGQMQDSRGKMQGKDAVWLLGGMLLLMGLWLLWLGVSRWLDIGPSLGNLPYAVGVPISAAGAYLIGRYDRWR